MAEPREHHRGASADEVLAPRAPFHHAVLPEDRITFPTHVAEFGRQLLPMLGEAGFQFTLPLLDHHVFAARKDNHLSGGDGELTIRECCWSRLRLRGGT